jgi:hypothetical protein
MPRERHDLAVISKRARALRSRPGPPPRLGASVADGRYRVTGSEAPPPWASFPPTLSQVSAVHRGQRNKNRETDASWPTLTSDDFATLSLVRDADKFDAICSALASESPAAAFGLIASWLPTTSHKRQLDDVERSDESTSDVDVTQPDIAEVASPIDGTAGRFAGRVRRSGRMAPVRHRPETADGSVMTSAIAEWRSVQSNARDDDEDDATQRAKAAKHFLELEAFKQRAANREHAAALAAARDHTAQTLLREQLADEHR